MAAIRKQLIALGAAVTGGVFGYVYAKIGKDDEDEENLRMPLESKQGHSKIRDGHSKKTRNSPWRSSHPRAHHPLPGHPGRPAE